MDLKALVHADIKDLIPTFLRNRAADLPALRQAIAEESAQPLDYLACRMYGVGNPFGFRQVTTFGRQLREACAAADFREATRIVARYEQYLNSVSIEYVEAPPKRKQWLPRVVERRQEASSKENFAQPAERRIGERRKSGPAPAGRQLRAG